VDDIDTLGTLIRDALRSHDVLVTIGGVSVGDYDVVQDALEAVGVENEFHKVSIRPGKPLAVGRRNEQVVVGLPGNPVSAQVTATLFLLPLLRALQADNRPIPAFTRRTLTRKFVQTPGRRGFYRATVEGESVSIHDKQSSGSAAAMAYANALVTFSEESVGAAQGEQVDTLLLNDA
jgi:molybdopterin molybdotransferase